MNRRGFLQSLLGLSATAVLPAPALELLARTEKLPDQVFLKFASEDQAIINLIEKSMTAAAAMCAAIDNDFYGTMTSTSACEHEWSRRRDGRRCHKCEKVEFGVSP